jgi:hypothetical protein
VCRCGGLWVLLTDGPEREPCRCLCLVEPRRNRIGDPILTMDATGMRSETSVRMRCAKLTAFDRTDISYVRRTLAKISQASSDLATRLRVM